MKLYKVNKRILKYVTASIFVAGIFYMGRVSVCSLETPPKVTLPIESYIECHSEKTDEYSKLNIRESCLIIDEKYELKDKIKIVQISDLHIDKLFEKEEFSRWIETINKLEADILVFTGDLLDANRTYTGNTKVLTDGLGSLQAKIGKYAVLGNHDNVKRMNGKALKLLENSGFTVLRNQSIVLEGSKIALHGLDINIDKYKAGDEIETAIRDNLDSNNYNILLCHYPDLIDYMLDMDYELQLSGHSHAGQVVIGGVPLGETPYGVKYVDCIHYVDGKTLLVNRGIGYSRYSIRIGAPQTVDVINVTTHKIHNIGDCGVKHDEELASEEIKSL